MRKHPPTQVSGCFFSAREKALLGALIRQGADYEADNRPGGNGCQNSISAIVIVDPVIPMRRVIQSPIIIVAYDDRIGVITVMSADMVARHIVTIIHVSEGRSRVVIERTVSTPIIGPRRVVPEIVPTILVAIVIAIVVPAIIPVEIPVVTIVPVVIVMPIVAVITMAIITMAVMPVVMAIITTGIAVALIVATIV
jgi:hypothetical protein